MTVPLLDCDFVLPPGVGAAATLRGEPAAPSFDLGAARAADDSPAPEVLRNRERLQRVIGVECIQFLAQVHGVTVHHATATTAGVTPVADAVVTTEEGVACAVLTADCLPVLLCRDDGRAVAAAHAGWRGLAAGVLESTITALDSEPGALRAWLGAAIGPASFEVGPEVREAFLAATGSRAGSEDIGSCFVRGRGDRWWADLYGLARVRLHAAGVRMISGGGLDVYRDAERFFSWRRDGAAAGRQATLIWINRSS